MNKFQYESIRIDSLEKVEMYLDVLFDNRDIIGFPLGAPTEQDALEDYNNLNRLNCKNILVEGSWESKFEYENMNKKVDLYFDFNNVGLKVSNCYTFNSRMNCGHDRHVSPNDAWNNKKFFCQLLKCLVSLKMYYPTKKNLGVCIGNKHYIASQFRVSVAKSLYQLFGAKNVLDFCSGWGDRLVGAMSTKNVVSYTGVDPNKSLIDGYKSIASFSNKDINMICSCAEDVKYDKKFDFVFTSPPYYRAEKYSLDEEQSFKRYKKSDEWKIKFLFESIDNVISSLTDDGIVVINISDYVIGGVADNRIFYCDDMVEHFKYKGMFYLGVIGYRMAIRPGKDKIKKGCFV